MRLEHVGIHAHDPETLARWYEEKVGLRVVRCLEKEGRPPIYFLSDANCAEIEILPTAEPRLDRDLASPGFSHVGVAVDDFEETEKQLATRGIALHGVRETSNGWRIGYFDDPEGNTIEIVHRPQTDSEPPVQSEAQDRRP